MTQVQFEKVIEEVKALSPAEQRQLRTLLDTFLSSIDAPMTENEFAYKLVEIGVMAPQLTVVTRTIA